MGLFSTSVIQTNRALQLLAGHTILEYRMTVSNAPRVYKDIEAINKGFKKLHVMISIISLAAVIPTVAAVAVGVGMFRQDTGIDVPYNGTLCVIAAAVIIAVLYIFVMIKVDYLQELSVNAVRSNSN